MRSLLVLLVVAAPVAAANKIKAKFVCKKVLKDGSSWVIGNEGYRIEAERIECSLDSPSHKLLEGSAVLQSSWHKDGSPKNGQRNGEPIAGDKPPFSYKFTLEKGAHWEPCATDTSFEVTVIDSGGQVVFTERKTFAQDCKTIPVAPPVAKTAAKAKPEPSRWEDGAKEQIPADARDLAQQFVDAVVDSDPPTLGTLASAGVKKGNKTLKGADVYDITAATGIAPSYDCDENQKNCHWGKWLVINKKPTEFWIYTNNNSGYGKFACAVFTKKGSSWVWTAVKSYDTGEP
jgi:hypothetical protein